MRWRLSVNIANSQFVHTGGNNSCIDFYEDKLFCGADILAYIFGDVSSINNISITEQRTLIVGCIRVVKMIEYYLVKNTKNI